MSELITRYIPLAVTGRTLTLVFEQEVQPGDATANM
jgi:hypothetical protein